ncbi:MAG: phosphate ABC transporter permease PstA [Rhodospirillales bacterium]|jgi:phosphate transport system permease protein|nr:phosphate ABC transporter permease PstA [Rhodospirillales bacterium]
MTNAATPDAAVGATARPTPTSERVRASLARRYRAERRFRAYGMLAIFAALGFLVLLFSSIIGNGYSAFWQANVRLNITFDAATIDPAGAREPTVLATADYASLIRNALTARFPGVSGRTDRRKLTGLVSQGATYELARMVTENPALIGQTVPLWLLLSDDVDMLVKGHIPRNVPESDRRVSDREIAWLDALAATGDLETRFNVRFFTNGDSREPELAGIWGATVGSFLTMLVTIAIAFPLGVASAVYLEEFARKNHWTDLIEVNINNLAAVPSIVFGLLGLAVFLNFFGLPRSAPVVGGLVLAIMTLPTIIIAGRAALTSVPPSIREAAYGLGASPVQAVFHHVLPLAMPGMLTGAIIGMARALGETAPLLMIGMVAFIVDIPHGFRDPSTVLPVQVYLWADSPERAFVEKTSAAIMVLLAFLIVMNAAAVYMRKKFEVRW